MLTCKFIVVAALCQLQPGPTGPDPTALIQQLGAGRFAERESASRALERMGRPALSALRSARESRDPEVRARAAALVQKIEDALLTQPSRLQLNFQNALLPDVVKSFSSQTGCRVELYPQNSPRWRQRRIDLQEPESVEFWKAIDKLCDRAGLQYNSRAPGHVGLGEPVFALTDGSIRTLTPISDHGPFRVSLIGVEYQKRVSFAPSGAHAHVPPPPRPAVLDPERHQTPVPLRLNPVTNVQFSAQFVVAAEPRLTLSHARPIQLVEAVDDRGNSLMLTRDAEPVLNRYAGYFGVASSPVVQLQAQLHRPETAGNWIKKLRGFVNLTVSARRPDPLVIPLLNATGKTFESQGHRLTIHEIRPVPTSHNLAVELSIKANESGESTDRIDRDALGDGFPRTDPQHFQIEIIDASDRIIPWFQSVANPERSRFTLTLANQVNSTNLKELRYYSLTRAAVKIPFEFADIPMP